MRAFPTSANRQQDKGKLPAIDAYLDNLESVKDTLNKLLPKYSQRELSKIIGIPQRTISDIISGKTPRKKTLAEIRSVRQ